MNVGGRSGSNSRRSPLRRGALKQGSHRYCQHGDPAAVFSAQAGRHCRYGDYPRALQSPVTVLASSLPPVKEKEVLASLKEARLKPSGAGQPAET